MLKNKSGKIINITSVVGHTGNLGQVNYTASKAGIIAMSKSLAIEYAKKHLAVLGDENHKEASGIYHTIADIYRVAKMDGKAIMYYEKSINTPGYLQDMAVC